MDATNDFNILLAMAISENTNKSSEKTNKSKTCLISGEALQDDYVRFA